MKEIFICIMWTCHFRQKANFLLVMHNKTFAYVFFMTCVYRGAGSGDVRNLRRH